jgi:hypothetical protein
MGGTRFCEKCGSSFPVYDDTNINEKYCVKHRGLENNNDKNN